MGRKQREKDKSKQVRAFQARPLKNSRRTAASLQRRPDAGQPTQRYEGYVIAPGGAVDNVRVDHLSPEDFWTRYICERRPVLIRGHLRDETWQASIKWTDEYLTKHAGAAELL
eukprot:4023247-Pyramimonas_sp.AAC.1